MPLRGPGLGRPVKHVLLGAPEPAAAADKSQSVIISYIMLRHACPCPCLPRQVFMSSVTLYFQYFEQRH